MHEDGGSVIVQCDEAGHAPTAEDLQVKREWRESLPNVIAAARATRWLVDEVAGICCCFKCASRRLLTSDEIAQMRQELLDDPPRTGPPSGREYWNVHRIVSTLESMQADLALATSALQAVSEIRQTIIRRTGMNWSGDMYPLVAILNAALNIESDDNRDLADKSVEARSGRVQRAIGKHREYWKPETDAIAAREADREALMADPGNPIPAIVNAWNAGQINITEYSGRLKAAYDSASDADRVRFFTNGDYSGRFRRWRKEVGLDSENELEEAE